MNNSTPQWNEEASQEFIDNGRYFVPERETQMQTVCGLIPPRFEPFHVLELCCGEGLLAEAILKQYSAAIVHGYDGSPAMLAAARQKLAAYGERFDTQQFELGDAAWRIVPWSLHAVVSSLAIHHLDGAEKQQLFADVVQMLAPGGAFIIADVIQPTNQFGTAVAAGAWDRAVQKRALELDGNMAAYDFFKAKQWNMYLYPDPIDKPSPLFDQLQWLAEAGFEAVDVYWMQAGHAIFGGRKPAVL
jgi:tRNA (cmo5U34)-methyltransferase